MFRSAHGHEKFVPLKTGGLFVPGVRSFSGKEAAVRGCKTFRGMRRKLPIRI
ncbi:hypothetical protein B4135_0500 [Caldibacillus debilis]|uniref:Uncharacterized protein n=1 Tax=Caldibacillus debilis TaxID=301148 RepID=A0A150L903_9BACI|nr:hypothetical protein B4135_0500 [Caldibacillus debilis]